VATEVDHLFPLARGGTDVLANVVPCCRRCNAEKSDMTLDEWRAWRIERGRPWPPVRWLTLEVRA
jgi:5-methylcytosine-specific restriction endonuclease McrA